MTVQQGKHTTVLEMEFCVLDFCLVTDSVYRSDYADPESVLVLLTNDLVRSGWFGRHTKTWLQVAIDCKSTGLPSHENPYAMDFQVSSSLFGNLLTLFALQESAVTCCEYVVDCPPDVRQCSDKLFIHVQLQSLDYSLPLCCRVKRKEVLRLVFKVR